MRERTQGEIIEALEVIKDVCDMYNGQCDSCPLRRQWQDCGITDSDCDPRFWNIHKPEDWTAF